MGDRAGARLTRPRPNGAALRFDEVYRDNARFVWRTVRRLGVREADVEDVCQKVFIIVHRKLDTYDGSSKVTTWLFGICYRVVADHRRRAHHVREVFDEPAIARMARAPDQQEGLARQQARALLDRMLDQLDEPKRAVFVLSQLEQLPMKDVAEAVGCPLQTAYSRLHAAQRQLEALVAQLRAGEEASR